MFYHTRSTNKWSNVFPWLKKGLRKLISTLKELTILGKSYFLVEILSLCLGIWVIFINSFAFLLLKKVAYFLLQVNNNIWYLIIKMFTSLFSILMFNLHLIHLYICILRFYYLILIFRLSKAMCFCILKAINFILLKS